MALSISVADGLVPLRIDGEDLAEPEFTEEDLQMLASIRERESSGDLAMATWLRSALGAIRATRRATQYIEAARNGNGSKPR